jgi:methylated-DNA-[protein]-cysteine S-methyltransferase
MLQKGDDLTFALFDTCLGWMGIVASPDGLKNVILPQKSKESAFAQVISWGCATENDDLAYFGNLSHRLRQYLEGEPVTFPDKLDLSGATRFQQGVWQAVQAVPYGETRTYGWVTGQIGSPRAARAVGQALAKNPLPIVIPCHRVISSDGSLGGFSGGLEIKEFLLRLERAPSIKTPV